MLPGAEIGPKSQSPKRVVQRLPPEIDEFRQQTNRGDPIVHELANIAKKTD